MNSLIIRIIFVLKMNILMDVNKMEIGDCYISSTDRGKVIGFVLLDKDFMQNRSNALRFAIVCFKQKTIISLEDFMQGEVFTRKVYIGLKGDYEVGLDCYDVYPKEFDFLTRIKQIGHISIQNKKIVYASGTNYTNELFFNLHFNNIETSNAADYVKENLVKIIN